MKECPFCGQHEQRDHLDDNGNYAVRCEYCGAIGPWHGKNYASAMREWDMRGGSYASDTKE